jgi:hypothetical protein
MSSFGFMVLFVLYLQSNPDLCIKEDMSKNDLQALIAARSVVVVGFVVSLHLCISWFPSVIIVLFWGGGWWCSDAGFGVIVMLFVQFQPTYSAGFPQGKRHRSTCLH